MPQATTPRVIFVTTDFPPGTGGLQAFSYRIARDFPDGLLKEVLLGEDHASDHGRQAVSPRPRSETVAYTSHSGRSRWRALAWSLRRVIEFQLRGRADFQLHMQWSTALPSYLLRRLGASTHYVVLIHGAELLDPGRPLINRIKAAIFAGADAVVAGSAYTAQLFTSLGLRSRRLEVIPYGNPLEGEILPAEGDVTTAFPKEPGAPPRLLCMHRLVPRKGTALLLNALASLTHLPWTLEVVGEGVEEASLRRLAASLGIRERLAFSPPVDTSGKVRRLSCAAVFILPSLPPEGNNHAEGLGLGLLEAQSLGVPVLAARTGGIPEAVHDGETGLLFHPGDGEDLREKLAALLESRDLRKRLGEAGPAWVRSNFSWQASLGKLASLIEEIARVG